MILNLKQLVYLYSFIILLNILGCGNSEKLEDLKVELKRYQLTVRLDTLSLELIIWLQDSWLTGEKESLNRAYKLKSMADKTIDQLIEYQQKDLKKTELLHDVKILLKQCLDTGILINKKYRSNVKVHKSKEQGKMNRLMRSLFNHINIMMRLSSAELKLKTEALEK
ncbi:MAG: hypothetical protein OEZ36_10610 [Spirochaetota bacterium]|nr:hypothetical protein [Spirochaetota bacterium]